MRKCLAPHLSTRVRWPPWMCLRDGHHTKHWWNTSRRRGPLPRKFSPRHPHGSLSPSTVGDTAAGRLRSHNVAPRDSLHRAVPCARAPRARSVHRSGNLALKKSRRRAPTTRAPRGVKRRQSTMEGQGSPRRKRPQQQHESEPSNAASVTPDLHRDPAGAPLPMSRHALSYLRLTGAITYHP